jgi:hypothetical protein
MDGLLGEEYVLLGILSSFPKFHTLSLVHIVRSFCAAGRIQPMAARLELSASHRDGAAGRTPRALRLTSGRDAGGGPRSRT